MKAPSSAVCLLALSAVACGGAADIPPTPDLRELLGSYERPSATLDGSNVDAVLKNAPNLQALVTGMQAVKYIASDVNDASDSSSSGTRSNLRLQGSVRLKVRCPGERSDPIYDEAINGSVSLTVAVADSRILRSMGGEAKACVLQGTLAEGLAARIQLDGEIAFDLGGDIGVGQYWSGDLLASLPGQLRVGDYMFESISARLTTRYTAGGGRERRFQHLVRLEDGVSTIVLELTLTEDGKSVPNAGVAIRDATGVWFCGEGQPCAKQ